MGHNSHIQGRNGNEIINCADPAKTQAKSINVTADVTPDVTANVTGGIQPVEAGGPQKAVDNACGMTSQIDVGQQRGAVGAADMEQGLHEGGFAAPPAASARENAGAANTHHANHHADIGGPLSEQTNRNTLIEHADLATPGRSPRREASRKRFSQGDLPPNLTRDRDAYVFQRRVPKSVFGSTAESAFTKKHSSRILRIRLGPMSPPEAKKRARHLNAFFDILVASMSSTMNTPMNKNMISPEQPDPFDILAGELRRLRDAFAGAAPPLDPATAIYATHIRDIVHAERARKGGESDDIVARHAPQITANAFSRMQTFSSLMDQLNGDPGLLDHLGAMIGDRNRQPSGPQDAAHDEDFRYAHRSTGPMKYSDHDGAEHAQGRIRMNLLGHQGGDKTVNPDAASMPLGTATAPVRGAG